MFKELFNEVNKGGQESGTLEMKRTNYIDALDFTKKIMSSFDNINNLEKNFNYAKSRVHLGKLKRKEMPVITSRDVHEFKDNLEDGTINDILDLPFKVGKVKIKMKKVKAKTLIPIQSQLYFDKSMKGIAKNGADKTRKFLKDVTYFITSSDNNIIDGHHRWLQALLIDPEMMVQILEIDMPINKLLPTARSFGDYSGNARNK